MFDIGLKLGSPPPMRGKAETFAVADLFVGITPAYAGKSLYVWHYLQGS